LGRCKDGVAHAYDEIGRLALDHGRKRLHEVHVDALIAGLE